MSDLDVTELLRDPDFCREIVVTRRTETLVKGRSVVVSSPVSPNPRAVVAPGVSRAFRLPEGQSTTGMITVYTAFKLQGPAAGRQPDLVTWKSDTYAVLEVNSYDFGEGFVEVLCQRYQLQEAANG